MEFQNIHYFLTLFEEMNFGRAAKRCGIAQPSLSNAIRRLELEVGGALFVRRPRVKSTPLAFALKPRFEQIVRSVQLAQDEANRFLKRVRVPPVVASLSYASEIPAKSR
jgi:LysR family hydrogen peroxide-inducible transcriptional activator